MLDPEVYEWTQANCAVNGRDFRIVDDPESGWAVKESEIRRLGYVFASEAVEAWEPVEVVSERELTPDEFFQAVEGDESFADVYALAGEQGYTQAQYTLGFLYYQGMIIPQDFKESLQWYTRAANKGHVRAQYNLGMMYNQGVGVSKDNIMSIMWLEMAVNQGDELSAVMKERIVKEEELIENEKKKLREAARERSKERAN